MIAFPVIEDQLLQRYRGGIAFVDSNLLLLYLIGKCDRRIIPRFQRTSKYTIEDFSIVEALFERFFRTLVTTPNVLTEVSNLASKLSEKEREMFFDQMKHSVAAIEETYCSSRVAVEDIIFRRFGLTDATILNVWHETLVVTDDLPLYVLLAKRGRDVVNFTHIRAALTLL